MADLTEFYIVYNTRLMGTARHSTLEWAQFEKLELEQDNPDVTFYIMKTIGEAE